MADVRPALVEVAREMGGIVSVYLFGSVAESREHAESDVDIGVLLDRGVHPTDRARFDCRLILGLPFRPIRPISPICPILPTPPVTLTSLRNATARRTNRGEA